jgi:uncharacterized protein YjbI with pentapeptide repeats
VSGALIASPNWLDTKLTGANLTRTVLAGASLSGVISGGTTGTPASLPEGWVLSVGYLIGPGAFLSGAFLSGANLSGANLSGANLSGANLTNANLAGVMWDFTTTCPNGAPGPC